MSLFKKKKAETHCCCGNCTPEAMAKAQESKAQTHCIKVLGSGCKKCNELEQNTKDALAELQMDTNIEHVTDFTQIAAYGVMTTPALVIDGKVASYGKVVSKSEAMALIKKIRQ